MRSILVADPNVTLRWLLTDYLDSLGYDVHSVADGKQAFERRQAWQYQLIFMDTDMPIMDGYESAKNIRRFEASNRLVPIPIFLLSAGSESHKPTACVTGFLRKPVSRIELGILLGEAYKPAEFAKTKSKASNASNSLQYEQFLYKSAGKIAEHREM